MTSVSGAGVSSIVCGSLALCFACGELIYLIYILTIVGLIIGGSAYYGYAWLVIIPSVLLLVTGSLAVAAGAKTVQKGTWIAAIVFSVLTIAAFVTLLGLVVGGAETLLGSDYHIYLARIYALMCIPIALGIGMVVSAAVGTCQSDTLKQRQAAERQQTQQMHIVTVPGQTGPYVVQGAPQYNGQAPPAYPQVAQNYYVSQPTASGGQQGEVPQKNYY